MDRSMRGDDEIAVLTKHNSCKGLYTGMVRACLDFVDHILGVAGIWLGHNTLVAELLSRKSVIENVLNIPFIRSS